MDHPVFGPIQWSQGDGWIGTVQVGFFSEFDDVASALFAEKLGGYDSSKTAARGHKQGRSG